MPIRGLLLLLVFLATAAPASGAAQDGGFAAISTPDLDRSAGWYEEMLGYQPVTRAASPDGTIRIALLRRGDHLLEIVEREGAEAPGPAPDRSLRHGIFKLGLVVPDVGGLEMEMRRKGAAFDHGLVQPAGNPWRTFAVRDPDGNRVQFFGP